VKNVPNEVRKAAIGLMVPLVLIGVFIVPASGEAVLRVLFPDVREPFYPRASLPLLLLEHLGMTAIAGAVSTGVGVLLGVLVTRGFGKPFRDLAEDLSSLLQTFPPVAVIALSVPVLGFGVKPTVAALVLYSVLPVLKNTITGISSVPEAALESARGMGMSPYQTLTRIELALAARVILSGVRVSTVMTIGTATVGAVAGAGGLGAPIVAGLSRNNAAYVFQGAILAALLAFATERAFSLLETLAIRRDSAVSE
jgi:osmoprotectant transport system permease protein